jgi:rhodanese-related sulfurtransferase
LARSGVNIRNLLRLVAEYVRPRARIGELGLEQARIRSESHGAMLFDCNLAEDYRRRHLPGAQHVGIERLDRNRLPANRDAELIFYCSARFCLSSQMAARQAVRLGYRNVSVMPDGIRGWARMGYPLCVSDSERADPSVLDPPRSAPASAN